jgi:LMP1
MTNDSYFNSEEFLQTLHSYEEAEQEGRAAYFDSDTLADIAEYYYTDGRTNDALNAALKGVDMFPGAMPPLVFMGRYELLKQNNPQKAEWYLEQVDDQSEPECVYLHAEIMLVENKKDEADEFLRQQLEWQDDAERDNFILDVADIYLDYDLIDHAQEWLSMVEDTQSTDYQEVLGRIALGKGEYQQGEEIFKKLVEDNPFASPYWNQLASSQFLSNRIKDSIESSEYSIAINPNDEEALLNKANGMFSLGEYEEALTYYTRFNNLHKDDETGEIFIGITLINLDRPAEALQHLQKAEEMAVPRSVNLVEIYQETAFALSRLGRVDDALAYVDKAIATGNGNEDELTVFKGHIQLENGNPLAAQNFFLEAVRHSKSAPNVYFRIAISVYDNGYMQLAYRMFHTLFQSVPDDWKDGYSHMSLCCKHLNKESEFLYFLRKACELNPMEAKTILGEYFPKDLDPESYYNYITKQK